MFLKSTTEARQRAKQKRLEEELERERQMKLEEEKRLYAITIFTFILLEKLFIFPRTSLSLSFLNLQFV